VNELSDMDNKMGGCLCNVSAVVQLLAIVDYAPKEVTKMYSSKDLTALYYHQLSTPSPTIICLLLISGVSAHTTHTYTHTKAHTLTHSRICIHININKTNTSTLTTDTHTH
jgi:hypothetical protein